MSECKEYQGTIVGWPRPVKLEKYQEAAEAYSAWLAQNPGVVSVYEIGDVGAAGLSDIDLVVVLNPEEFDGKEFKFRVDFLPPDLRYLMMHGPVFLSESLFQKIFELLPIFKLKHRAGKELTQTLIQHELPVIVQHVILNDLAIISLHREYKALQRIASLNLRNTIARINSLKYPLRIISSLGRSVPGAEEFEQAVSTFRANFFDMNETEVRTKIFDLLTLSEYMASQVLTGLGYLNDAVAVCKGSGMMALTNGAPPIDCSLSAQQKGELSPFHFAHLQFYGKGSGLFSSYIRQCLVGEVLAESWESEYLNAVQRRGLLLNDYHSFLSSCGIGLGRVFEFGYQERRLSLKIKRGIDKLRHHIMGSFKIPGWEEAS